MSQTQKVTRNTLKQ